MEERIPNHHDFHHVTVICVHGFFNPVKLTSGKQRITVDVRKAVRNSVSGQADRCKALEARPPSEEGKQVSLIVIDPAPC